jgi:hypothetical protein
MPTMKNAAMLIGSACLSGLLVFAARAQDPGTQAPIVSPAEPTVLPNAPKVGDTSPSELVPSEPTLKAEESAGSPDWPCVQRKVLSITPAQIWDGPSIDDVKGWEGDERIAELTDYLESRRIPLEDAEKAIKEYAESIPAGERDKKLTALFASVLSKINTDRQFVIGRVEEFQRRQKARAKELEREGRKLSEMNQEIPPDEQAGPRDVKLTTEQQEYNWNARIFQERQQSLTVACEIPVLIEQRAYEISRLIRAQMAS